MNSDYLKKKQRKEYIDPSNPESNKVVKKQDLANADEWEKQFWFWRSHIDIFIPEYFSTPEKPLKLFDFQSVIARNCGNCIEVRDVEARSMGKTFKMSLILSALAMLYSGNKILIVSKTVRQAILTIKYIDNLATENTNLAREIILPVTISKDGAKVKFKNGSEIEALAMNADGSNLRGLRKKIIYIDESAWVKSDVIQTVLMPILQYKRDIYWSWKTKGVEFEDFDSKLFETSSAYLKSCDFFDRFKNTLRDIKEGSTNKFACALNYKTGVRCGIVDEDFVLNQKDIMPSSSWEMEWNSKFIGATDGSYFPYDLTEPCRDLSHIEIMQPKGSTSRYILSLDVATSEASSADNACMTITKISEKTTGGKDDGTFNKYLVYIRTYHGWKLEQLANEIRKMCVRFGNIEKVIVDANAIGEGITGFLNMPYIDDEGKEHPPFVADDLDVLNSTALPIVRAVKADNAMNGRMATSTRIFLENRSLHLPIPSNTIRREQEEMNINIDGSKSTGRRLSSEEIAVYLDADGLQYEMGNVKAKLTAAGNTIYDTPSRTLHKDRYSSLAMAMEYISQLEKKNRKEKITNSGNSCWGVAMKW